MIQKHDSTSAGRPAVKPRPTPGGKPTLPEFGHGPATKPAFPGTKPSFGADGFAPGVGKPGIKPGIKPGGPHWGGGALPIDKLPACPLPKGEPGEGKVPGNKGDFGDQGVRPGGPFKLDGSFVEKFLEKFKN